MRPFLVLLITLLLTAVSSSPEQCAVYHEKVEACHKEVVHDAETSAADDRLKTKHLVCCFTHILLDCIDDAAVETSCQLDDRDDISKAYLVRYMRFRCDKYHACNGRSSFSYFSRLTFVMTLFAAIFNHL